jgi:ACT domain-containing protein
MKAVISVIGKDRVGIIAKVSGILSESNVNILDISQTIMQDIFTMVLISDISSASVDFVKLKDKLAKAGEELGVSISVQHEDLFNSMHRI